jgi:hypothetical protein
MTLVLLLCQSGIAGSWSTTRRWNWLISAWRLLLSISDRAAPTIGAIRWDSPANAGFRVIWDTFQYRVDTRLSV